MYRKCTENVELPAERIMDMVRVIYDNFVQSVVLSMKILMVVNYTVFRNIVEERQCHIQLPHFENRNILPFHLRESFHKL